MADEKENNMVSNNSDNTATHSSFQQDLTYILLGEKHNNVYRVPDYQRGYAWEERQVRDLWEDILNLFYGGQNRKHYTGMIVLDPIISHNEKVNLYIEAEKEQTNAYYIVDGQQRLTTLIIFLFYVIDKLNSSAAEDDKDETDYFVYSNKNIPENTYRFGYCNNELNDYFIHRVFEKNDGLPISDIYEKNIDSTCKFAEKVLHRFDNKSLHSIKNILLKDLLFNIYGIRDDFDVRTTFETMNNRGKQLSSLELLKNRLMYLADQFNKPLSNKLIDEIDACWNAIYKNLSINSDITLNDDDFLRAHWFLYHKATKLKGDTFKSEIFDNVFKVDTFIEKIRKSNKESNSSHNEAYSQIWDYAESLKLCSLKWAFINYPNYLDQSEVVSSFKEPWKQKTINMIKRLSHIPNQGGSKYLYPILMGTIYKEPENPEKRYEFYQDLERYIFLNSCVVYTTKNDLSGLIKDLHAMIHGINYEGKKRSADDVFDDLSASLNKLPSSPTVLFNKSNVVSTCSLIHDNFFKKCFYDNGKCFYSWNGIRYFLYDYDERLPKFKNKHNDWNKYNETSIEHIFPETPLSARYAESCQYWATAFDGFLPNEDDKEENERNRRITHMLGNLVLLSDTQENSSLSNRSFPLKCGSGSCLTRKHISIPPNKFTYVDSSKSATNIAKNSDKNFIAGHFLPQDVIVRTEDMLNDLWNTWIRPIKGCALKKDIWIKSYSEFTNPLKQFCSERELEIDLTDLMQNTLDDIASNEITKLSNNNWEYDNTGESAQYNVDAGFKKYYLESEFSVSYIPIHQAKSETKKYKPNSYVVLTKYFNTRDKKTSIEYIALLIDDGPRKIRISWDAHEENGIILNYVWNEDADTKDYIENLELNNKIKGFVNCFKSFGEEEQKNWISK